MKAMMIFLLGFWCFFTLANVVLAIMYGAWWEWFLAVVCAIMAWRCFADKVEES